jgi:hypothetical protein
MHPSAGAVSFFAAARFPSLPLAACRGLHELYDRVVEEGGSADVKAALATCEVCPELARCGDWLESLPLRDKPFGVTAGRLRRSPRGRAS